MTIDERINGLDLSLFGHVCITTPEEDQITLLALQSVIRKTFAEYTYLEIGSFRGGSLQPYVVDPRCTKIISIDPRPKATPDAAGRIEYYENLGVEAMLDGLRRIPGANMSKVQTFEASTSDINPKSIGVRPELFFVDGEHTDEAMLTDARFCLSILAENGAIVFHDANRIYNGLQKFLAELKADKRVFRAHILPNLVFLIEFGTVSFCNMEPLRQRLQENYQAYLVGMANNDYYRQAYPLSFGRLIKELKECDRLPIYQTLRKFKRFFIKSKTSRA